jgi:hypothetical protein
MAEQRSMRMSDSISASASQATSSPAPASTANDVADMRRANEVGGRSAPAANDVGDAGDDHAANDVAARAANPVGATGDVLVIRDDSQAAYQAGRGNSSTAAPAKRWLFSAPIDLALFAGTAIVALLLVPIGPSSGAESPEWTWITGVLLVDVAHVWSTAFVVYLDPAERQRRPALYAFTPLAAFAAGVALYVAGEGVFWRVLAYLAAFHFIRQQYGWVMMYRARAGERDRAGRWLDGATVYAATLYPLIVWHTQLPRAFWWMKQDDFVAGLPALTATIAGWIYAALLATYAARAIAAIARRQPVSWGKHVVVAATAACWYVGIVATNADYAFTVTNVFIHGVPYLALVYLYARAASREPASRAGTTARMISRKRGLVIFLATLWAVAYAEELIWDRAIWHDRGWLFGGSIDIGDAAMLLVPLLAVPQLTHYVLDGFLWRRRANPRLGGLL